jgi:translocation and assembly module TamB
LSATEPDWVLGGAVSVQGRIRGTPQNPNLSGVAHLTTASLGKKGVFTNISALNGDLFFDGNRATLSNVEGHIGGGTLRLQGTALIQQEQIQGMNIQIESKGVRLEYPTGLRTVVDGTIALRGSWGSPFVAGSVQVQNDRVVVNERVTDQSPLLEGNIQIQSMSYRNDFEQFLQTFQAAEGFERDDSPLGRLRLAVHVSGGRNISIQNQLANVEARIDLDVKGSVSKPAITGHIEASGGTLSFQGHRYQVTRGNVDFVSPVRIDPVIDLQAETQVRDYRVILIITGKSDKLNLAMSSDPPLSQFEIINLIAGGKTREELAASSMPVPTQERLFQGGAASMLSDLLEQRIGNKLPLLGDSTSIRIDPSLVGTESGFSPRITILRHISGDLSLTYSQDLASNKETIIQIEYFVSRNVSILASRDELGDLGLDIRLRKRFK